MFAPESYRIKLLTACHDSDIGGHRDHTKTLKRIQQQYWWIGMTKDCKEHVASCEICQQVNNPNKKTLTAPLKPYPIPQRFNEQVPADLVGPLLSNTENKYILVLSDAFTKWVELVPIKDKTSNTVVEAILNNWILKHARRWIF